MTIEAALSRNVDRRIVSTRWTVFPTARAAAIEVTRGRDRLADRAVRQPSVRRTAVRVDGIAPFTSSRPQTN
jgi:hypothetical protein